MLSVVVTLGFVRQEGLEASDRGDEFDHMAPLCDANCDVELVIVDRAWPQRWNRVVEALKPLIDRGKLKYIPPKPSPVLEIGFRASASMRNAGAICSNGELIMFIDDFFWLDPRVFEQVVEAWDKDKLVLCPVMLPDYEPPEGSGPYFEFSGHNPGIYMASRDAVAAINGFDENYDGSYGEEDTDFQNRLDRHLLRSSIPLRRRRRGLLLRQTKHVNGDYPEPAIPPWEIEVEREHLRCNRLYHHAVGYQRVQEDIVFTNTPLTDEELEAIRRGQCTHTCEICHRDDKEQRIESYRIFTVDKDVGKKMRAWIEQPKQQVGKINPWEELGGGAPPKGTQSASKPRPKPKAPGSDGESPQIDVIVPVSNVAVRVPYLRHCLRSIRAQRYPKDRFEIIVVCLKKPKTKEDYGPLAQLCAEMEATLVFRKQKDPAFSLGYAYNLGARRGSREAVAFLNCDIYFHPDTFSYGAKVLQEGKVGVVPVSRGETEPPLHMFKEHIPNSVDTPEWNTIVNRLAHIKDGMGNAFYPRSFFERVHGFDERLYGWGAEDFDLFERSKKTVGGVFLFDLGCPRSIHIAHPGDVTRESSFTQRNRKIVFSSTSVVRNSKGWGGIPA